ncbi:porin family protein [Halpernia sp.]|uniref:porin family protein n=1 Tax=Halpernia sp. TaxID=2782209 RepID=UPI003A8CE9A3
MKKLLLVGAIALFSAVSAQKNSLLIGGNIGYNTSKTTVGSNPSINATSDQFSFNPLIGYQFADHLTAGVKFGVSTSKDTFNYTNNLSGTQKTNSFTYGVFGRYTIPLSDLFAVYGDLYVFGMNGKITTPSFNGTGITYSDTKTNGYGISLVPNIFINLKNSFKLNFNIGGLNYTHNEIKGVDNKTNQFGFQFGKGAVVGISKNFKL